MKIETKIHLDKFSPRSYQLPFLKAMQDGCKKALLIWPRRSGKEMCSWQYLIRRAAVKPGVYYYIFPTYSQGRKILADGRTNSGESFFDMVPREWIDRINNHEMKLIYKNNAVLQILGSDNIDSLVGSNPMGIVYSEYSLQTPLAYSMLRPILVANDGWLIVNSTPRGKNHLWELYQIALNSPEWFVSKLSLTDTQHIPLSEIEKERAEGLMSEDLIQQEYYTSFDMGVEGSFFSKYLDRMRLKNQIGNVPWESSFPVHTAWDIGVRDSTCIIFFQIIGHTVRIIDCYEKQKEGLEHYINVIKNKPYSYSKHIAPHDIAVQEFGSGITRIEKARQLGIKFTVANNVGIMDGIEAVRSAFSKIWIDEVNCKELIKALENYRQEYDARKKVYNSSPLHNWASHYADAMRYLCVSLPKTEDGLSAQELDKRYTQHVYGGRLPGIFGDYNNNMRY